MNVGVGRHVYKAVLTCSGIPHCQGAEAAADIAREFVEQRSWHKNVRCIWDGEQLILEAENDYDPEGKALADEFSDCVSAFVAGTFGYQIAVESVIQCS